jgi:hypothetical protein
MTCTAGRPVQGRRPVWRYQRCALAIAGLVAASVAFGQPADSDLPTHVVRIDAIAVDSRGHRLEDLKPADFELREDSTLRPVESVQFMRAAGPRRFAIFLDEYHVSAGAAADRVRTALTRFVDALDPKDLLVVMKPLDSLFAIRLSDDREAARRLIAAFEGRKGDYEPRNAYERNYIAGTPARIEAARAQVALSAMNALAIQLGTEGENPVAGRKTLVVVAEGITADARQRDPIRESCDRRDLPARSARGAGGGGRADADARRRHRRPDHRRRSRRRSARPRHRCERVLPAHLSRRPRRGREVPRDPAPHDAQERGAAREEGLLGAVAG